MKALISLFRVFLSSPYLESGLEPGLFIILNVTLGGNTDVFNRSRYKLSHCQPACGTLKHTPVSVLQTDLECVFCLISPLGEQSKMCPLMYCSSSGVA